MADKVILTIGTKRGLFLAESNKKRKRWKLSPPLLKGWAVYDAIIDTRGTPRLHVAAENFTFASNVFSGPISGNRLKAAEHPPSAPDMNRKAADFANQHGLPTTKRLWLIAPGPPKQKKTLYAGTAPAGLFRSEDSGKSWHPIESLNQHETREDWNPGAGGQSLHSFQVDPHQPNRLYAAISAAGAFRSDNAGESWKPINECVQDYMGAPKESLVGT